MRYNQRRSSQRRTHNAERRALQRTTQILTMHNAPGRITKPIKVIKTINVTKAIIITKDIKTIKMFKAIEVTKAI